MRGTLEQVLGLIACASLLRITSAELDHLVGVSSWAKLGSAHSSTKFQTSHVLLRHRSGRLLFMFESWRLGGHLMIMT
jgi:hypothetical protein